MAHPRISRRLGCDKAGRLILYPVLRRRVSEWDGIGPVCMFKCGGTRIGLSPARSLGGAKHVCFSMVVEDSAKP